MTSSPPELTGTKLELTLAAEQMFAEHGLNGATLRQIREAAGQKNESVIHYHFGSREAIIEAILFLRARLIDRDRLEYVTRVREENNGLPLSSTQIARCSLMPLAHYVLDRGEPGYYARFLLQLRADRSAWRRFTGTYDRGVRENVGEIYRAKPNLPVAILNQRFLSMMNMHLHAIAAIEDIQAAERGAFRPEEGWIRVADLIGTSAAVLDAPLLPETIRAIRHAHALSPLAGYQDISIIGRSKR